MCLVERRGTFSTLGQITRNPRKPGQLKTYVMWSRQERHKRGRASRQWASWIRCPGTLWGRRQAFQPGCYCNTWCGDGEVFLGCWGDGEVLVR